MEKRPNTPSNPNRLDESTLRTAYRRGLLTSEQLEFLLENLSQGLTIDTLRLDELPGFGEQTIADFVQFAGAHATVRSTPLQRLARWITRHPVPLTAIASLLVIILFAWHLWQEGRHDYAFKQQLDEATHYLSEVSETENLTAGRPPIDHPSGLERRETPAEAERLKRAVDSHVIACAALDRALQIRPGDEYATRRRLQVGLALGRLALQGRKYALARQSFMQLEKYGLDRYEIGAWIRQVDQAEAAESVARNP